MKCCSKCKLFKEYSEFQKNKTKKDGYSWYCKSCMKIVQKESYKKHKQGYKNRAKTNRNNTMNWVNEYKSKLSCSQCGENHIATLDFHHKDKTKKENTIAKMKRNFSISLILEEINKCIILCSNCHRKLHWKEGF